MPDSPFNAEAIKSAMVQMMAEAQAQPVAAPPKTKSHTGMHASLAVMGGGQLADALTTMAALQRDGTAEGNPLYGKHPSAGKVLGIKAATMVPLAILLDRIHNKHPKLSKGLAIGVGALGAGLAARNSQMGKK